ncbi:TonB-dependent receptor [Rhodocyclus tenuis]|uniref:TonB-dependent receptor n=1 Tax=Rhodocyclus gracilis TaxID=2929842 RepID=UPI001298ADCA|nr:TonB-dependent receptor [Rhodocyclus gracilis]MRD72158.1 TonB-dependent receptor [Rhodocyclus gracilis]
MRLTDVSPEVSIVIIRHAGTPAGIREKPSMACPHFRSKRAGILAASICLTFSAHAEEQTAEVITVSATRVPAPDVEATYASEIHTRKNIDQSGAATLYEYLSQHTSLTVAPSYGNTQTPKIDMRGYGAETGYQNIVITVDGRRINNIDMAPAVLGALPLIDIERIEITKGSGSVLFGDGATAGSIQIYTRPHKGVSLETSAGSYGASDTVVSAGAANDRVSISATAEKNSSSGFSDTDPGGKKDNLRNDTWRVGVTASPVSALKLRVDAANTYIDTRYPNSLTLAQFNANPAQAGGRNYNHWEFNSAQWGVGADFWLNEQVKLVANHSREDKRSNFVNFSSISDYDYASDDLSLHYLGEKLNIVTGYQLFDGSRHNSTNTTTKKNTAWFAQSQYRFGDTTISAGTRSETVDYRYSPTTGARLDGSHSLSSWDVGLNQKIDAALSVFGNVNHSFQAPDIDRFFVYGGGFNGFIKPAEVTTINIGLNHVTKNNRLKLTVFRAKLKDEIYYEPVSWTNTNIDSSHKQGIEVQDNWTVSESLIASANYALTKAIIDSENQANGAYNGKELPGVSRHSVNLGLNYRMNDRTSVNLTQIWRSSTWAANDFTNSNTQKQKAFASTDLAVRYRLKDVEIFGSVDNIFNRSNGYWISDDKIYPVNFTRNWRIGFRTSF